MDTTKLQIGDAVLVNGRITNVENVWDDSINRSYGSYSGLEDIIHDKDIDPIPFVDEYINKFRRIEFGSNGVRSIDYNDSLIIIKRDLNVLIYKGKKPRLVLEFTPESVDDFQRVVRRWVGIEVSDFILDPM